MQKGYPILPFPPGHRYHQQEAHQMAEKSNAEKIDGAADALRQFQAGKASIAGVARLVGALAEPELHLVAIATRLPIAQVRQIAAMSKQLV